MGNLVLGIIILLLTIGGWAWGWNYFKDKSEAEYKRLYSQYKADGKLERSEIQDLLANLPAALDRDLSLGALCYETISVTATERNYHYYVCPLCMMRTAYETKATNESEANRLNVLMNINEYRRLVKQVKGIDVKLDESQFCRHCSPGISNPHLLLVVNWENGSDIHKVEDITAEDLEILAEFVQGAVVHKGERDVESLLLDYSPRLKRLLGFPVEAPDEKTAR